MPKENKPLPADKQNKANAVLQNLPGAKIKEAKQVVRGSDEEPITENLITVELQDGSTLTVDADNPDHDKVIEKAHARVEGDINAGKRKRSV